MGKYKQIQERKRIAIIGDGKTESIYIDSLKSAFRNQLSGFHPVPLIPKHSSVAELKKLIEANLNYDKVLCVIDMDTKLKVPKEMAQYQQLKLKYSKKEKVIFYETHPCTELWFFYYFQYTTAEFGFFEPELKRLLGSKISAYEKREPYCTHQYITKFGGNYLTAVINGRKSEDSKKKEQRDYTYSEMAQFFEEIEIIEKSGRNKK